MTNEITCIQMSKYGYKKMISCSNASDYVKTLTFSTKFCHMFWHLTGARRKTSDL